MLDDGEQGPLEEVMKGRLNKALLTLVTVQFIALFVVLFLAYYAGAGSNGQSLGNFGSLPGPAGIKLLFAVVLCLGAGLVTWFMLSNRVMAPVKHLADFFFEALSQTLASHGIQRLPPSRKLKGPRHFIDTT